MRTSISRTSDRKRLRLLRFILWPPIRAGKTAQKSVSGEWLTLPGSRSTVESSLVVGVLMSNPEQQPPEKSRPPDGRPPAGGPQRRPDRPQSSNLFWFLMIVGAIAAIVFSVFNQSHSRTELSYSEFYTKLTVKQKQDGQPEFHRGNIYELVIGADYIQFQDKPKEEDKAAPADTK